MVLRNTIQSNPIRLSRPWQAFRISYVAIGIASAAVVVDHVAAGEASVAGLSFPAGEPEATGIAEASLEVFDGTLNRYVENEQVVGAEMLIIKNRQTIFHRTYGWKDREHELPMELNTIFNIRSMTKPITGVAIHLLADEGLLGFDDKASRYLAAFDNEKSDEITIEHLLTHRSGVKPCEPERGLRPEGRWRPSLTPSESSGRSGVKCPSPGGRNG